MRESGAQIDGRYIAALCIVSVLILVAGVWFRPSRTPPPIPSELETLTMQLTRQRLDLDRRSLFYSRKAEEMAKDVAEVRARPEIVPFSPGTAGQIVVLVATDSKGELVWAPAQTVGAAAVPCDGLMLMEVTTTIAIPSTLSSAVAFDLDNKLVGLVVPCEDRRLLVTPDSFRMWTAEHTLEANLAECCGLRVTKGLEVFEVRPESALAEAGLRNGDTILTVAGAPLGSRRDLHAALTSSPPPVELTIQRANRTRKLRIRRLEASQ